MTVKPKQRTRQAWRALKTEKVTYAVFKIVFIFLVLRFSSPMDDQPVAGASLDRALEDQLPKPPDSMSLRESGFALAPHAAAEVCWWAAFCSPWLAMLQGVMAITRRGLPEPPTIFSGAAMTMAPVGGS